MKYDMVVAGVGGQGILSISFVVDNAAMAQGLRFKQSEVHGMAQRGGAVVSHLRVADSEIFSDLIPKGSADLILSMEPLEALRYSDYLAPDGAVVASANPFVNIPDYPDEDEVLTRVQGYANHTLVNAAELARAAGSGYAQNMVILGAASHLIPLDREQIDKFIGVLFSLKGDQVIEVNLNAFRFGAQAGGFYRAVLAAGATPAGAVALATRLHPWDFEEQDVAAWVELLARDKKDTLRAWLRGRTGLLAGDASIRSQIASLDFAVAGPEDYESALGE